MLPYAKQFLTPVKPFFGNNKNIGDRIDYGQRRNDDIGGQVRYYEDCTIFLLFFYLFFYFVLFIIVVYFWLFF